MSLEFQKFRVRTPIKTFRDLDVYKNTTLLCAEIFNLKLPEKYRKKEKFQEDEYYDFYPLHVVYKKQKKKRKKPLFLKAGK